MATQPEDRTYVCFGTFEFDTISGELREGGIQVNLQDKPLQILILLLANAGEVVSRDQIQRRLWPDGVFVDFERGLNTAIKKLRFALRDDPDAPAFIETLPRKGYRFVAAVVPAPSYQLPSQEYDVSAHLNLPSPGVEAEHVAAMGTMANGIVTGAPDQSSKPRWPVYVLSILLIGLCLDLVFHWFGKDRQTFTVENTRFVRATSNGRVRAMAISPDGRTLIYARRDGLAQSLRSRDIGSGSELELLAPDTVNFSGVTISPDGTFIYFIRSEKTNPVFSYLCRMPASGGAVQSLIRDADSTISFSPDGRRFAFTRGYPNRNITEVRIAAADGTNDYLLASMEGHQAYAAGATWSPDGKIVAVPIHVIGQQSRFILYTISLADGRKKELFSSQGGIGRPLWIPSGNDLLVTLEDTSSHRGQLWLISYPDAQLHRVTNDLSNYSSAIDISRDGSKLATLVSSISSSLWSAPRGDESRAVQLTSGEPKVYLIHELPDGSLLGAGEELWRMDGDGKHPRRFSNLRGVQWIESCGRSVLVQSSIDGNDIVVRLDPDTRTDDAVVANGDLVSPVCTSDGTQTFYMNFAAPEKIHRMGVGGEVDTIADVLGDTLFGNLTLSPNGKLLAYPYQKYAPPFVAVAVIPAAGGKAIGTFRVPGFIGRLRWSPDGRALHYLLTENDATNLWEQSVSGGPARQLTHFAVGQTFDFDWSNDGMRLLMTRGDATSDVVFLEK